MRQGQHQLAQMKQGASNDFQTPPYALAPLLPYLKRDWVIWECACGRGNITKELRRNNYEVVETDLLTGFDFMMWQPHNFDCIVTNPPYSIKQEFLERAYMLGKPFALLLPLTALETRKRQRLFEHYGLEIIFMDKRINFETPSGEGTGSWFATAWFTNWLNIGKAHTFAKIKR